MALSFLLALAVALALTLGWAFRHLPREHWQILAAVPTGRTEDGGWRGVNLTTYGLVLAGSLVFATALFLVLARSVGVEPGIVAGITGVLLAIALPAARVLARIIEKKRATFTVGGAVFVAFLIAPAVLAGIPAVTGRELPALPLLAALGVAYCFGEGLGRLSCLSFGCCYGRPVDSLPEPWRRWLAPFATRFSGATKKASYESGFEGRPLVPIQAITATVLCGLGLAGCALFLAAQFRTAFLLTLVGSQLWRAASELLRADHRGGGRMSTYQRLALVAVPWALGLAALLPVPAIAPPDLAAGFSALWHPTAVVSLEALGLAVFLYTGVSQVTGSTLRFHVHRHEV
jgi:hypothetical protein